MVAPGALQEEARGLVHLLEALLQVEPKALLRVVLPKILELLPLVLGQIGSLYGHVLVRACGLVGLLVG